MKVFAVVLEKRQFLPPPLLKAATLEVSMILPMMTMILLVDPSPYCSLMLLLFLLPPLVMLP